MTVEWWEMNLETCSGYEKHFSGSRQYVSKKIKVIRRVEVKILQEIDEKVEKDPLKNVPEPIFGSVQKSLFDTFRRKLLLQMAVEWWEMNLETCSGYEKHSSGSGQYPSSRKNSY